MDADGVLGGRKKCDVAPTLMSSFGGRVVSKVKESGMTVWTEVITGAECRITKLLAYDTAKRVF